jgi:DNA-binding MarR family transcriptional regulator
VTDETSTDVGPLGPTGPARTPLPALSVSFFLIALGRRAQESVEARLREQGLAYHHLSALGHLKRQPGLSYSELARRARVTVQSMQTTAGHLEQRGLVERGATTSPGRRADLRVTARGLEVLAAAEAAMRSTDQELLAGVPATERAALESALLQMFAATLPGSVTTEPPN